MEGAISSLKFLSHLVLRARCYSEKERAVEMCADSENKGAHMGEIYKRELQDAFRTTTALRLEIIRPKPRFSY